MPCGNSGWEPGLTPAAHMWSRCGDAIRVRASLCLRAILDGEPGLTPGRSYVVTLLVTLFGVGTRMPCGQFWMGTGANACRLMMWSRCW